VCAELGPHLLVASLADEVQVELSDGGQEAVRVVDRDRAGFAVVDRKLVVERQFRAVDHALEDAAGMHLLELDGLAVGGDGAHGSGRRTIGTDHRPALRLVGTEDAVGIRVLAVNEPLEVVRGGDGHVGSVTTRAVSCR
jgi:hypothetical protein